MTMGLHAQRFRSVSTSIKRGGSNRCILENDPVTNHIGYRKLFGLVAGSITKTFFKRAGISTQTYRSSSAA